MTHDTDRRDDRPGIGAPDGAADRGAQDTGAPDTEALGAYFDAARHEAAAPSGDFMARLAADALRVQPVRPAPAQGAGRVRLRDLLRALGGWPTVAGLTAAACAGVWLGASAPGPVLDLLADRTVYQNVDPLSGFDIAMLGE